MGSKKKKSKSTYKTYIQYMLDHGVKNPDSLDFKRLNCDIPQELHTWLNIYARSNQSEYTSMTEIVISLLGKFAKENGFKIKKCGYKRE